MGLFHSENYHQIGFYAGIGLLLPRGYARYARNKQGSSLPTAEEGRCNGVEGFRPISLVHGAINIFDKILFVRLMDDLPRLVGVHQSAFVHGRSIHDNFMLVQCTARKLHALRNPSMIIKQDISKALDTVSFIMEVLKNSTSSTRILINGIPGAPIHNRSGLGRGGGGYFHQCLLS